MQVRNAEWTYLHCFPSNASRSLQHAEASYLKRSKSCGWEIKIQRFRSSSRLAVQRKKILPGIYMHMHTLFKPSQETLKKMIGLIETGPWVGWGSELREQYMRASSRGGTLIGIKNKPRSDDTPAVYQPPPKIKLFSSDGLGSVGKKVCFRSTPPCLSSYRTNCWWPFVIAQKR